VPATLDHVVIRAADLDSGSAYVERELGVTVGDGGRHAAMGTHNRLIGAGGPYLEVIAVDPDAEPPGRARWFGLDGAVTRPQLAAWVLRVDRVPDGPLGDALEMGRDGLTWQVSVPGDGSVPFAGSGPMLIAWEVEPPSFPESGLHLVSLVIQHPRAGELRDALTAADLAAPVSIHEAERPRLIACFDTPLGPRTLSGDGSALDIPTERQAAMDLFHQTWRYLDSNDRLAEHDAAMLDCAEASLWHWRRVGAPTQWAIGEWQCSRVHAVLGRGEAALAHARRALDIAEADRVDDFVPASAHEALSRAYAVLGDMAAAREERNIAYRMALELDDEDRDVIEHDLGTIPIPLD
jgi:hypothetical protein